MRRKGVSRPVVGVPGSTAGSCRLVAAQMSISFALFLAPCVSFPFSLWEGHKASSFSAASLPLLSKVHTGMQSMPFLSGGVAENRPISPPVRCVGEFFSQCLYNEAEELRHMSSMCPCPTCLLSGWMEEKTGMTCCYMMIFTYIYKRYISLEIYTYICYIPE